MPSDDNLKLEAFDKKIEVCRDEKARLEENMKFITKIFMTVFTALFIYTAFAANVMLKNSNIKKNDVASLQKANEAAEVTSSEGAGVIKPEVQAKNPNPNSSEIEQEAGAFEVKIIAIFGISFAVVVVFIGTVAVKGIAHIVSKRLMVTSEIRKTINKMAIASGHGELFLTEGADATDHFLKIPVIFTWASTIIIFASYYYCYYIFDKNLLYAFTLGTILSSLMILVIPNINIYFFNTIKDAETIYNGFSTPSVNQEILKRLRVYRALFLSLIFSTLVINLTMPHIPVYLMFMPTCALVALLMFTIYGIIKTKTTQRGNFYDSLYVRPIF